MRSTLLYTGLMLGLAAFPAPAADFPEAAISNGVVEAKFHLPDAERGYYRGTRFDWSGAIYSLKYAGHEYFGQWFPKYDPKLHDAIMGPVEEYLTNDSGLGYSEAKVGETFVRIGVGGVRKPEERGYQRYKTYEIVNPGKRSLKKGKDWIEFVHELKDESGYAYVYKKRVKLVKGKPQLALEHSLKNTGRKTIETSQYNHNFFVMDKQPTGPDFTVKFAFDPRPDRDLRGLAEVKGRELVFPQELKRRQSAFTEFTGFGASASDYDFRIENRKIGAGVRIRGDRPLSKVVFWSIPTTLCPEPYIDLKIEPGREVKWTISYEFYTM